MAGNQPEDKNSNGAPKNQAPPQPSEEKTKQEIIKSFRTRSVVVTESRNSPKKSK